MENNNNIKDPKRIAIMRHEVLRAISVDEKPTKKEKKSVKKILPKNIKTNIPIINNIKKDNPPISSLEKISKKPTIVSDSASKQKQIIKIDKTKIEKKPIKILPIVEKKDEVLNFSSLDKKNINKTTEEEKIKIPKKIEENIKINNNIKKELPLGVAVDTNKKAKKQSRIFINLIMFFFTISLFLLVMVFWIPKSESVLAKKISSIIPFPAIVIGKKNISYHEYLNQVESIEKFLIKQKNKDIQTSIPNHAQIREDIKNYFIKHEMVLILARQNNIIVTDQDIDNEVNRIYKDIRSQEELDRVLNDIYGLSRKDYEEKFIRPRLLGIKLSQKFFSNVEDQDEIKKRWDDMVDKLKKSIKIYIFID